MTDVTLSLVSHTNAGKTTLARTLLRRDVGEVADEPHVTEKSEAYELFDHGGDRLLLWDTPGFGDSVRLLARLRREATPIGWFLHQVWDRARDRPLWCSQEAVRNVQRDADVVLYLVNAAELPEEAGYVDPELELLAWLGKPVLVLLNQVPEPHEAARRAAKAWRAHLARHAIVRGLLPLDAFTRAWVQEDVLLERVVLLLEGEKREAMRRLAGAWSARNRAVFEDTVARVAEHLARTATDREELSRSAGRDEKRAAMEALARRLEASERELWDAAIAAHGLEGRYATLVREQVDAFVVTGDELLTPARGAMLGGALTGALGGLTADLFAGGFTFGGGLLAGTILGALGGAGLSRAVRLFQGDGRPAVGWSPDLLDRLFRQEIVRYLALACFGRGRGRFEGSAEDAWRAAAERAADARREALLVLWRDAVARPGDRDVLASRLSREVRAAAVEALASEVPEAREALGA